MCKEKTLFFVLFSLSRALFSQKSPDMSVTPITRGAVNEVPDSAGKGTSLDGKWLFLGETRADFGLYRL
jgi:hypothetical protein